MSILSLWLGSRLLILSVLAASAALPVSFGDRPADFVSAASRWDAAWILEIAKSGYESVHEAAFFPAFPLAVAAGSLVAGSAFASALALNSVLSLLGALLIYRLSRLSDRPAEAVAAAATVLLHPLSFYLSVPYTEGLFLLASLACMLSIASNQWIVAALCGALAALTRNTGALLVLPMLYYAWESSPRDRRLSRIALALSPVLALGLYSVFTLVRFGEPLAFITAQAHWGEHIQVSIPFAALVHDLGRWRAWADHHLPLTLLGIWLAWRVWRYRDRGSALLVMPPLLLSISLSKLAITPRLHLVLFPLWIEAGRLIANRPAWQRRALAVAGLAIGSWLTFEFSRGKWVD